MNRYAGIRGNAAEAEQVGLDTAFDRAIAARRC